METWSKTLDIAICHEIIGGSIGLWQAAKVALEKGMNIPEVPEKAGTLAHHLLGRHSQNEGELLSALTGKVNANAPDAAPLFPLGLLGSMLPDALHYMQELGADEKICRDTFSDIMRWVKRYIRLHGKAGVDEFDWIILPYAGCLFEIGGLQYQTFTVPWPLYAWRDTAGNLHIAADAGVSVSSDGFVTGTGGKHLDTAFITSFHKENNVCSAHWYDTDTGEINRELKPVSLYNWTFLFATNKPALNLHIPAGALLQDEAVQNSFAQARDFFLPLGYPCEAVLCESWLLDPQLKQWLKTDSSILTFARRFARFRVYSTGSWAHRFLFGCDIPPEQLADTDAKTSLQKAVLSHWRSGNLLYDTGGIAILQM